MFVNVGFFMGEFLDDPHFPLRRSSKRMRHVKLRLKSDIDSGASNELIHAAYTDTKGTLPLISQGPGLLPSAFLVISL
jgi:hypothetical protein